MPQYLDQMEVLLKEDNVDAVQAIMNGTFYGLGRLRDHMKKNWRWLGNAHTAVLVNRETGWKFHATHWSIPAE